jgi:hypothetical protein
MHVRAERRHLLGQRGQSTVNRTVPFQLVGIASLIAGCDTLGIARACTEIGCRSGLQVNFNAPAARVVRVEIRVYGPGSQPVLVYDCTTSPGCSNGAFFPDFSASAASITVVTVSGSQTTNMEIEYTVTRPNGPDCPPECSNATVVVGVPSETSAPAL